jgi:hypothetical protein
MEMRTNGKGTIMKKIGRWSLLVVAIVVLAFAFSARTASSADKPAKPAAAAAPAAAPAQAEKLVPTVNAKCPVMGGLVNMKGHPENLTLMYKDQRIGFCCPMCLPKWDAMTDAEKDAALKKVMTPAK